MIDKRTIISPSNKYQLSGPDKTPLQLIGTTTINLKIENVTFPISVCVIKNLSSTIILGNEFLEINKAKIDYTNKLITLDKTIKTKIMNSKFSHIENHIENIEHNIITPSPNIIEADIDILNTTPQYSIAHTISADLQHDTDLSNRLIQKYGNMSYILDVLELIPGEITTIDTEHRSIHYLISKEKYNISTSYIDLFDNLYNLKNFAIKEKYEHIALCVENLTHNELKWDIIKNMIFEIFNETKIHLLLCHTPTILKNKKTIK